MTTCDDVCIPGPGVTVLGDGRVIWYAGPASDSAAAGMVERRLLPAGLRTLGKALDAVGSLTTDGTYEPVKTSDADTGHGFTWYRFRRTVAGRPVEVLAIDPDVFDADNDRSPGAWAIPKAMRTLSAFARAFLEPQAWFASGAWAGKARSFPPTDWLLIVGTDPESNAGVGELDVYDVEWPFSQPVTEIGEPYTLDGKAVEGHRCLVVSHETMTAVAAAESLARSPDEEPIRSLEAPYELVWYDWMDGPGTVTVTSRILLPDQPRTCDGGGEW